jgi:guanylate kinase
MNAKLFVLSGSSGCGKTTLMNNALKENLSLFAVQKYGTRRRRETKDGIRDDVCQVFDKPLPTVLNREELDLIPVELDDALKKLESYYILNKDVLTLKENLSRGKKQQLSHFLEDMKIRKPLISIGSSNYWDDFGDKIELKGCIDIAYALNKGQYGICTENIWHDLRDGKNVITVLSDFRIINRLKIIFKDEIIVSYIASAVDTAKLERIQVARLGINENKEKNLRKNIDRLNSAVRIKKWEQVANWIYELNKDWEKLKPDAEGTSIREERIKTFHTRYVDSITLFDYTILNYNEGHQENMTVQFNNILNSKKRKISTENSPIFVVIAASNAGKGTMMEMLNLIGSDRVQILSKIAKRKEKQNDKKDGMLPIGTPSSPPNKYPEFPKWWSQDMINIAKKGEFPSEYDFSWRFHGETVAYAISDQEIQYNFQKNKVQIVVSNIGQIEEFIRRYNDRVVFIFLYRLSSINDIKEYYEFVEELSPNEAQARAEEVNGVLQGYIEKISFFNHVILNTTRQEDLYDQIFQLVEHYHKYNREK